MRAAEEGIDPAVFARLLPSQFLSFSFPNPLPPPQTPYSKTLRLAVADSPSPPPPPSPPAIAAILVPPRREHDWLFSTAAGHFQLLLSSSSPILPISRLLLIGNLPNPPSPQSYSRSETDQTSLDSFQQTLFPLLLALCPKSAFLDGIPPSIPFLSYEDDLIRCTPVETLVGTSAGEMLVEDVEIEDSVGSPELRRRLRFKKMPNLIQTQVRLLPADDGLVFRPEMGSLAQPYLGLMVSALFLNGFGIDEAFRSGGGGGVPRVLCIGVGGGPLLMSLRCGFGFRVLGVEMDDVVLRVARRHFGLVEGDLLKVVVDDGIRLMEDYAVEERSESELFHAIMVDLDEEDPMNGVGAPPAEFLEMSVLVGARKALHPEGILVVNAIVSDELLYARMIELFRRVFCELYELRVEDGENFVVVATVSPVGSVGKEMKKQGRVYEKLKQLDCERFIDGIRKI